MPDIGRGSAITGLLDLPITGTGQIQCRCFGFNQSMESGVKSRFGRDTTNRWGSQRPLNSGGFIVCIIQTQTDAATLPLNWEGIQGTLTRIENTSRTSVIPVMVIKATFTNLANDAQPPANLDGYLRGTIVCQITDNPTYVGYPKQGTGTTFLKSDEEQWAGTAKIYDPVTLGHKATRSIDVWGDFANTDAAELTIITDAVSSVVSPISGLSCIGASFQRDSLDGGTLVMEFGGFDSKTFKSQFSTSEEKLAAIPSAWGDLMGMVNVTELDEDAAGLPPSPSAPDTGDGTDNVQVQHIGVQRTRGIVTLERTFIIASDNTAYQRAGLMTSIAHRNGFINDDEFLGYPAHTLLYSGAETVFNTTIGTAHLATVIYKFMYDSFGFVNDGNIPTGWCRVAYGTTHLQDEVYAGGSYSGGEAVIINQTGLKPARFFYTPNDGTHFLEWPEEANFDVFFDGVDDSDLLPGTDFTATPLTGPEQLSVDFTDTTTHTPTAWEWEKNDGSGWVPFDDTPTAQNPTELFAAGTWSIRLTATNANGSASFIRNSYITVSA